jgi:hypothetical protein
VSTGKFLEFIIHEHGIEIDLTKIESINKVQLPQCKNDMQKFLGKFNPLWFLCPILKFGVPTLFRKLMEFSMTLIYIVSWISLRLCLNSEV